jgi:MFS family permease
MSIATGFSAWLRTMVSGLPRAFWYLWLGTLINRIGIFVIPFLSLFLTSQRGLTTERATFAVSLYGIGSFTAQIAGGFLADRIGRRLTMVISLFGSAAILMILSALTDYTQIAVTVLLLGLLTDLYRPASSALIADTVPPEGRAHAYSLRYWAINLGASIGLSLGGVLASHSYLLLFIGDAGTTFLFGLIILLFVAETHPGKQKTSHGSADKPHLAAKSATSQPDVRGVGLFVFLFAGLAFITASVYVQNDVTLPLAMRANGFSAIDYGSVVALNGIVIVLVSLPLNRYLTRYSRFLVIASAALLTGIGFGLYALPNTLGLYALGVVIWTIGELIFAPLATTIIANLVPPNRMGFYQGIFGASYGLAAFAGPATGGFLYAHYGATTLWIACLVLCCIISMAYLLVVRPFYGRLLAKVAITHTEPSPLTATA